MVALYEANYMLEIQNSRAENRLVLTLCGEKNPETFELSTRTGQEMHELSQLRT